MVALHASSKEVVCVAPRASPSRARHVSVSLDGGVSYSLPAAGLPFTYYNASLVSVAPLGGPRRGGTLVTISASGLAVAADLGGAALGYCRFGALGGLVEPLVLNESLAICRSPPRAQTNDVSGLAQTAVVERLSSPAQLASGGLEWTYYDSPVVSSLQPADGPALGGYDITVRGSGFTRLGTTPGVALCRFGGYVTPVRALTNGSMLVCPSPALPASAIANALGAPAPAAGVGADWGFELLHSGADCCRAGGGASLVRSGGGYASLAACQESCAAEASCRFLSYGASTAECVLCSACDSAAAPGYASYRRIEPSLPALLPFALSLNGQQWATNELDETAEVRWPASPRCDAIPTLALPAALRTPSPPAPLAPPLPVGMAVLSQ